MPHAPSVPNPGPHIGPGMTTSSPTCPAASSAPSMATGYGLALASACLLAFTGILIKYAGTTYQLPPLVLAFWRNGMVCAILLPILLLQGQRVLSALAANLRFFLCYGGMLALFNTAWTSAVLFNGAAVATVMVYASTAYTALLARLLLRETCPPSRWLAMLLCLAGCVLVSGLLSAGAWQANGPGIVTGLASGLLYAGYSLMGRSAGLRGLNPWVTLFHTFAVAALCLGLLNLCAGPLLAPWHMAAATLPDMMPETLFWDGWLTLLVLAAGPTMLGFGLYNVSLCHLPSSVANLILTLEPALTALVARWLLDEHMNTYQWGGTGMILCGVILLRVAGCRITPPAVPRKCAILLRWRAKSARSF